MRIVLFEDAQTDSLAPITISRPAYAISCASYRLVDVVQRLGFPVAAEVRPHLRGIQESQFGEQLKALDEAAWTEPLMFVNARMVPSDSNQRALLELSKVQQTTVSRHGEALHAAVIFPDDLPSDEASVASCIQYLHKGDHPQSEGELQLFNWPHEVVREHMQLMEEAMERRIREGDYKQLQDGVFVGPDCKIGEHAIIDTSDGPIVLEENVQVGPFCYFSGPVYAGAGVRVIEHASLKDAVALGHTVKIGGEVEASVIEPYTNKQHHGFLGHSYLGSWINLGAGTCNSDLKNTYGKINIEYRGQKVASGMQFLGCIVGDYSKTAINTGIFTGKVIGVCSMLYGFVTENVPSFVNYAQIFGQVAEIPADVMIATQARMFSRRKVVQQECDIALIRAMYDLTNAEREQMNQLAAY